MTTQYFPQGTLEKLRINRNILISLLVAFAFAIGISCMALKVFPYNQVMQLKRWIAHDDTQRITADRNDEEVYLWESGYHPDKSLVFVTFGQSNSVNFGQIGYEARNPVFMVQEGRIYPYKDPSFGGNGSGGSVWSRVGDKLIEQQHWKNVYFTNAGWGGLAVEELTSGHYFEYFLQEIWNTLLRFGKIDGILFHQGEANNRFQNGSDDYYDTFVKMLDEIRKITDAPIYLSQTSVCGTQEPDPTLLNIQNALIRDLHGVLRGPNTDKLIDPEYRLPDACHFSMRGLDQFSNFWVEALTRQSEG